MFIFPNSTTLSTRTSSFLSFVIIYWILLFADTSNTSFAFSIHHHHHFISNSRSSPFQTNSISPSINTPSSTSTCIILLGAASNIHSSSSNGCDYDPIHNNGQESSDEPFQNDSLRKLLGIKYRDSSSSLSSLPTTTTITSTNNYQQQDKSIEKWKLRLQLTKPISWIPLSLIVMCGAAASGNYHWIWNPLDATTDVSLGIQDALKGITTILLAGPFSEGFAQTLNDWYDQDIDAINEPYRPIPSGLISKEEVWIQLLVLFFGGMTIAFGLDHWATANHDQFYSVSVITLLGYFVSYIYSAPPLKLKQNGWIGAIAIGICYIAFPWWCGLFVFRGGGGANNNLLLRHDVDILLPLVWSIIGIGNAIMNDFKSVKGDAEFGLDSIPVMYGNDVAKYIVMAAEDIPPLVVAYYFYYSMNEPLYAIALVCTLIPKLYYQMTLLIMGDPLKNDVKYVSSSSPFGFLGVLLSALCIGNHKWV